MNRYDGQRNEEASKARAIQSRHESEHMAHNAHVKKVQAEQSRHAGREPKLQSESMHMGPYMCINGEHAQEVAREVTKGLDKVAFPVK